MKIQLTFVLGSILMVILEVNALASSLPAVTGQTNLAAGKPVVFSPIRHNVTYSLTDGKLTPNPDKIWGKGSWSESGAVGWTYVGRFNFSVDLGHISHINEVAIRFAGGTHYIRGFYWPKLNFPGEVAVFVSNDGKHYRKITQFSRLNKGTLLKLHLPHKLGHTWGYTLRFSNLDVNARYVGVRVFGGPYIFADEMWVFGKKLSDNKSKQPTAQVTFAKKSIGTGITTSKSKNNSGFTTKYAQPYFYKPYMVIGTNVSLPQPLGLTVPSDKIKKPLMLTISLPEGVKLVGGWLKTKDRKILNLAQFSPESIANGGTRYQIPFPYQLMRGWRSNGKPVGQVFFKAAGWENGQTGKLIYSFSQDGWDSGPIVVQLRAVTLNSAPHLKGIMFSTGWYMAWMSSYWPHVFDSWRTIGLNTFPIFGWYRMNSSDLSKSYATEKDRQAWHMLKTARKRGFKILNIDMTYKRMAKMYGKRHPEIYAQLKNGKVGKEICPSYRGKWYHKEIKRFASMLALVKPDYSASDTEIWGVNGPQSKQCTRCRADYLASGFSSWKQWRHEKTLQIWSDFVKAGRDAVAKAGGNPNFDVGLYNLYSFVPYHKMFDFRLLYPEWINHSAPSFYCSLFPRHLVLLGDVVRKNRKYMKSNDVMPWLTSGGVAPIPGWAMKCAWLETLMNGGRGIFYFQGSTLDGEDMVAINRVARAISPIEKVVLKGKPIGDLVKIIGPGRVSGMIFKNKEVILVADYFKKSGGVVKLRLKVPENSQVQDLLHDNKIISFLNRGVHEISIPLHGKCVRLLYIKPVS